MKLPRVLIIYTGGTFGMEINADPKKGSAVLAVPELSPESLKKRFLDLVPELKNLAECDVQVLLNRDSAHIGPSEWVLFADHIRKNWKNYDGIVLLHGTDTLSYTASALSFLLNPCLKPVVMTGAQRPLSALRTDARSNLIAAVEIAAHGPREIVNRVTVFFGDKLFQGNQIRKKSASDFAAFECPHLPPLAVVGTTIRYNNSNKVVRLKVPTLKSSFSQKVLVAHVTPGFPSASIRSTLLDELDALVLVVFHSWTAPTHDSDFISLLRDAKKRKLPIAIVTESSTQPPALTADKMIYDAGKDLASEGCLSAGLMTLECTYVKLSLLLGQGWGKSKLSKFWYQEFAGEGI